MVMKMENSKFDIHVISSMEKIFPEQPAVEAQEIQKISALKGECVSFQIAVRMHNHGWRATSDNYAYAEGEIKDWVQIRVVDCAPSMYPACQESDDNYLKKTPGLYPDILRERTDFRCTVDQWKCIWVSVWIPKDAKAGEQEVKICFGDFWSDTEKTEIASVKIDVIDAVLPKQKLIRTEWFHGDCLADYYHVPALSEEWWKIAENFVKTAARHGINMLLTPIFTQPLDTLVGGERTTIQLVGMEKTDKGFEFDFTNLERWIKMCQEAGIEYFEMAHLFTQWGAAYTPKIIVKVNGKEEKMFGWHVKADDPSYKQFLEQFLPALIEKLQQLGVADRTMFHVSDEPNEDNLETYQKSKALVEHLLKDFPIIDALSHFDFYEKGIITHPIPCTNRIEPFLEAEVPNLWTYYCCSQWDKMSNRFFAMPGARTRIIGAQLYRHHLAGFLQWGYNFYNTQYSREHINPYEVTDAGNAFPSGDAFIVYPGKDGKPEGSIRLMLMLEAMQDIRALELLETLAGREKAEEILMEGAEKLTFKEYPRDAAWLLAMRERVNEEIRKLS